jgi:dTDP-4-dehydrorhamnose reductase
MKKRYLVTGASGQLGSYLLRELLRREASVVGWSGTRMGECFGVPLRPVNLGDRGSLAAAFRDVRPDVVLHAGAMARVADCLRDPNLAHQVNTLGTASLAEMAAESAARLVYVSTDLVFDGQQGDYREEDVPAPVSVYGKTKLAAEEAVLAISGHLAVRVSLLFGPSLVGRPTFFDEQRTALRTGKPVTLFIDEWRTPLSLITAARALVSLADSDYSGLVHLGGPERLSRWEMGRRLAAYLRADPSSLVATERDRQSGAEPRPRDTSLNSSRWRSWFPGEPWPTFLDALQEMEALVQPSLSR